MDGILKRINNMFQIFYHDPCNLAGEDQDSFGFGGTGKFSANCRFSNYGQMFGKGDVITALLDLESRPPAISFAKNGRWFGVAHKLGSWPVGAKEKALFPHILSKNCRYMNKLVTK